MSAFSLRAHPRMSVAQLKQCIKEHADDDAEFHAQMDASDAAAGNESARTATSEGPLSPRMPPVAHASLLALHLDGVDGALQDDKLLRDYGLDVASEAASTVIVYFTAQAESSAALTQPRFDLDAAVDEGDELLDLSIVFANTPVVAAATASTTEQQTAEAEGQKEQAEPQAISDPTQSDSGSNAVPAALSERATSVAASNHHIASASTSSSSSPHLPPRSGGGDESVEDTGRRLLEDDGDIASSSDGEDYGTQQRQGGQNILPEHQQQQQEQQQQELDELDQQQRTLLAAATKELAAAAGLVKGDLLDGYRLLRACRVDLPEEVSRASLSGCTPPLVDAVPEHLAEFTNLTSLDVSGNNLPLDRLRLVPMLESLSLSANGVRDVDFAPILGIHYEGTEDPEMLRARQWDLADLIGFPALRVLDLSHNFLHSRALGTLAFLPSLRELNLAANELPRMPPATTMANFWLLTKLSLRDNVLGSGKRNNKIRRAQERDRELEAARQAGGAARKAGHFLARTTELRKTINSVPLGSQEPLLPSDDPSFELGEDDSLADLLDEHACPLKHAKEFALFRALAALPALVELDLSENCLACVPAGAILSASDNDEGTGGAGGFAKLQFLNLAWNELGPTEKAALPLGDLPALQWLDLRGNPFVTRAAERWRAGNGGEEDEQRRRAARHQQRHGVHINWAAALPDLYHVLVENCRINVVLSRPRHAGQGLQQDLSHLLLPPSSSGAARQVFSAEVHDPLATDALGAEAARHRHRVSSAKQRAFARSQEEQRKQASSAARLNAEAKEDFAGLPPVLGFSTAHEFESEHQPRDALQAYLVQQQLQPPCPAARGGKNSARAAAASSAGDPYAEQYAAYSDTFLTGMNVEDLQATAAFGGSGEGLPSERERDRERSTTATAGHVHYPHKQLLARRATQQATQALSNLLQQSAVPVLHAARPRHRVEGTKFPPVVNSAVTAARAGRAAPPAPRSNSPLRSTSRRPLGGSGGVTGSASLFGVRQPKVSKVYSKMDAVLQAIEDSFLPVGDGASATAKARHVEAALAAAAASSPNTRTVASSHYVDPLHARTTDKLRAMRHLEKERSDVQALLRTVSEVSKQVLTSPPARTGTASSRQA